MEEGKVGINEKGEEERKERKKKRKKEKKEKGVGKTFMI